MYNIQDFRTDKCTLIVNYFVHLSMENNQKCVVAVVGSRGVRSCAALLARLAELSPAEVVSGGVAGVDALAATWARTHGVPLTELRPDYAAHGPTAAPTCVTPK